ncbi:DUF3152 domain-containing protein [Streptomyces yaanensis]|uniref:DUF3152 domain-containing protein n=1 Tax=Streptomyces yaanensis TaxID=1142239 RepID=A0ABV7SHW0_9ACTN
MGRHSRKGRGNKRNMDAGPVPGVPAAGTPTRAEPAPTDRSARGATAPTAPPASTPAFAHGAPRGAEGTPAHGVPRVPDGTPARGVPRFADGTPAHGVPRVPDGTPAHGMPRFPDGTPAHGTPRVRGGHPQQHEPGGGWGQFHSGPVPQAAPPGRPAPRIPHQRSQPGPRQEYLEAFEEGDDVFAPRRTGRADRPPLTDDRGAGAGTGTKTGADIGTDDASATEADEAARKGSRKGRTFTGIAAAAVTTVLAVVVAGQVADRQDGSAARSQAATADRARAAHDSATRGNDRPTPSVVPSATPLTYAQAMGKKYPLSATLKGSGKFEAVPGIDKAPGTGRKYTYRVDVEKGLGLDGELFAQAVHKTLNDDRSWSHNGARTFERVHSGKPDFVITLASPGTTAVWCLKSGLDTAEDNVSCDSASTERVMINAYRWAQGSKTYGDAIHAYRQMLINHEVGHRLGHNHVTCDKNGELAPVMQQQTKFLDHDGIHCLPNPWPYPGS